MAIIQNRSTEAGDVLFIKTDIPIIGVIALLSFVDDTENENINTYFIKEFKYSIDGVNYSPYIPLTTINVANIEINSTDTLYLEYRYTRVGDESISLVFNEVTINGEFEPSNPGPGWGESIFNGYLTYDSICAIAWSVNVLEKLYKKGIVPEYIERNKTGDNTEDRDYLDFWRSVTRYFGYYVCLARYFKTFYVHKDLLLEYLRQRGLMICNDTEYQDILYLMSYYNDEVRQRGTVQIFKRKGFRDRLNIDFDIDTSTSTSVSGSASNSDSFSAEHPVIDYKEVDGEYLRLICNRPADEFIHNVNAIEHIGWNMGNSSPLYKGLRERLNTNKYAPDHFERLWEIELTGLHNITLAQQGELKALRIKTDSAGLATGLGKDSSNVSRKITINPYLSYELTFQVKKRGSINGITAGIAAFSPSGTPVSLINIVNNTTQNKFFQTLPILQDDKYYFISCIIHGIDALKSFSILASYLKGQIVRSGGSFYKAKRSVPAGILINNTIYWELLSTSQRRFFMHPNISSINTRNLQFTPEVGSIAPYILLDNPSLHSSEIYLHSVRLTPLSTTYSKGFLQNENMIEIWNVKNNDSLSETQILEKAQRYLFPYHTFSRINFLKKV